MSELQPLFQNVNGVYEGYHFGLPYRDIISEGVVASGDLKVTEQAPQAMGVQVAAGVVWVLGDSNPDTQPCYRCRIDASKNLIVPASDASNPRIDLIVAQVNDASFDTSGAWSWAVALVKGVAAANPVVPATPDNAVVLAHIHVGAAAGVITNNDITDERPSASVGGGQAKSKAAAIPGEVVMWPSGTLPDASKYGTWVWADGTAYLEVDNPEAFANVDAAWDTHNGKAAPAAGYRRVPDMRGSVPVGTDAMGGGAAAGRTTRATAIAAAFGGEYHTLTLAELAAHRHNTFALLQGPAGGSGTGGGPTIYWLSTPTSENQTGQTDDQGGGGAHENMPPANAIPFIVFLG